MRTRPPIPASEDAPQAAAEARRVRFRPRQTGRARALRAEPTEAERLLWRHLKGRQLGGWKFSRQMPVGPFVCDFLCREAKLVVELDGGQHGASAYSDEARSRMLQDEGYQVVRFWNNEVFGNVEGVLERLLEVLQASPPACGRGCGAGPSPGRTLVAPHRGGGE